jgi:hypothetical protein
MHEVPASYLCKRKSDSPASMIAFKTKQLAIAVALISGAVAIPCYISWRDSQSRNSAESSLRQGRHLAELVVSSSPDDKISSDFRAELAPRGGGEVLSPSNARALIDKFNLSTSDIRERSRFAADIIKRLCESGFGSEALELIDDGYGQIRTRQITAFFEHAQLGQPELLAILTDRLPAGDRPAALLGYFSRFDLNQLEGVLASGNVQNASTSSQLSFALASAITHSLSGVSLAESREVLQTVKRFGNQGLISGSDLALIIGHPNAGDAFDRWEISESIFLKSQRGDIADQHNEIVSNMVRSDAPRTMDLILGTGNKNEISRVINHWTTIDANGAVAWYESSWRNLDPQERDHVASAFTSRAIGTLEFDSARAWVGEINDTVLQEQLLLEISKKESEYFGN